MSRYDSRYDSRSRAASRTRKSSRKPSKSRRDRSAYGRSAYRQSGYPGHQAYDMPEYPYPAQKQGCRGKHWAIGVCLVLLLAAAAIITWVIIDSNNKKKADSGSNPGSAGERPVQPQPPVNPPGPVTPPVTPPGPVTPPTPPVDPVKPPVDPVKPPVVKPKFKKGQWVELKGPNQTVVYQVTRVEGNTVYAKRQGSTQEHQFLDDAIQVASKTPMKVGDMVHVALAEQPVSTEAYKVISMAWNNGTRITLQGRSGTYTPSDLMTQDDYEWWNRQVLQKGQVQMNSTRYVRHFENNHPFEVIGFFRSQNEQDRDRDNNPKIRLRQLNQPNVSGHAFRIVNCRLNETENQAQHQARVRNNEIADQNMDQQQLTRERNSLRTLTSLIDGNHEFSTRADVDNLLQNYRTYTHSLAQRVGYNRRTVNVDPLITNVLGHLQRWRNLYHPGPLPSANRTRDRQRWYVALNDIAKQIQRELVNKKRHTDSSMWGAWNNSYSYGEETVGEYIYKQLSTIVYNRYTDNTRWQVDTFNCSRGEAGDMNKGSIVEASNHDNKGNCVICQYPLIRNNARTTQLIRLRCNVNQGGAEGDILRKRHIAHADCIRARNGQPLQQYCPAQNCNQQIM